ncbi:8770_t:CDS:2 [Entrophospora sp. SA101]|nr:8770_t:CDS:2 [Entrophospora sp. SA101]
MSMNELDEAEANQHRNSVKKLDKWLEWLVTNRKINWADQIESANDSEH